MKLKTILVTIFILFGLYYFINNENIFKPYPIKSISILGNAHYSNQNSLKTYLNTFIGKNLFEVNLRELKSKIESDSWIKNATVKRQMPDNLIITFIEFIPLLSWNENYYIDTKGVLFSTENILIEDIPHIESDKANHLYMYNLYLSINNQFNQSELSIIRIELKGDILKIRTPDLNFTVRHSMHKVKLSEFLDVYDQFKKVYNGRKKPIGIDLRYPTGFSAH